MKRSIATILICLSALFLNMGLSIGEDEWIAPTAADDMVNPYLDNVQAALKGKKIFEKLCWTCHGMKGAGDGPGAEAISPKPADLTLPKFQSQSDGAIFWKIETGRGYMISYEDVLSENDRWKVVSYIRSLSSK